MVIGPFLVSLLLPVQAQATPFQVRNIVLATQRDGVYPPVEPSIAISKKDTHNIVAGVVLDRAFRTKDGGASWKEVKLDSPYGVFGDPCIVSDASGNFNYLHLTTGKGQAVSLGRIMSQRSTDGGDTWTPGAGMGYNAPKQQDKEWAVVHPSKNLMVTTWTQFDKYGSKDPRFHSNILFSKSTDGGLNWTPAQQVNDVPGDCVDSDNTTEGAVPAILPNGTVCVAWSNQGVIFFDRSKDEGKTWLPFDRPLARHYGGWDMGVPGVMRTNGMPVLVADTGTGPFKGSLYLVWGDQRNGETDSEIVIMSSRDGGDTWSKPMVVNADKSGRHQFFPWLAVDSSTGYVYLVYYDRRAYEDERTDVVLAYSTDGGKTFTERTISETPFDPQPEKFMGDYNNISAEKGVVAAIWTRMDAGRTSVLTAILRHADLLKR